MTTQTDGELGPPRWVWRSFFFLAVFVSVAAVVIGGWLAVTALGRQSEIRDIAVSNAERLERAEAFNGALGNASIAAFRQTDCRVQTIGTLDTAWRRALDEVIDAFIRGDTRTAVAMLPALEAAANVDIPTLLARVCPFENPPQPTTTTTAAR